MIGVADSVEYRVTHRTAYRYSEPVAICQNQLRMQPRSRPGLVCHHSELSVEPAPDSMEAHEDYFGNRVHSFAIESLHRALTVTVHSHVTVSPGQRVVPPAMTWEHVVSEVEARAGEAAWQAFEFRFDSPRVAAGEAFARYARASFSPGRPIVQAVADLTARIHRDFRYDTAATQVHTPTEQAFAMRAGVCQDFAHVGIACLRSLGLPARYVSGYLRTVPPPGQPRLVGADESHAWLSVYAGEAVGWVDCDPTNARLTGLDHIPVSVGRDYGDISPMRGVVIGSGSTTLRVSVDVEPVAADLSLAPPRPASRSDD